MKPKPSPPPPGSVERLSSTKPVLGAQDRGIASVESTVLFNLGRVNCHRGSDTEQPPSMT